MTANLGSVIVCSLLLLRLRMLTAQDQPVIISFSKIGADRQKELHDVVDSTLVTPQWLANDLYDTEEIETLRYPHYERRFGITQQNQDIILLSRTGKELFPNCSEILGAKKKTRRLFSVSDYSYRRTTGIQAKHMHAEKLGFRFRTFGLTDEMILPFLYLPTGWILCLFLMFSAWIFFTLILGSFLVHAGTELGMIWSNFLWGPVKRFLRMVLIKLEVRRQKWLRYLAPDYFLEPRSTWKMPYFLRHDYLEDMPPELAPKPPINKIDYSMYILGEDDYDEVDLEMGELEYIDEILQFKEEDPSAVARLLKYKLGVAKFYSYFDEDILSDDEDVDLLPDPNADANIEILDENGVPINSEQAPPPQEESDPDYLKVLELNEPWMNPEFDDTFEGSPYELQEIRKRREIVKDLKEEILYLHSIISNSHEFDANIAEFSPDERKKFQAKATKLLDKYVRYSNKTKQRIAEIEPSDKAKFQQNVALSKHLPLINQMSHYNHRLNLRHEKHSDPVKRVVQLDTFGGP